MENIKLKLVSMFSLLFIVGILVAQFIYLNSYAATYDQVDFALALERYDLLSMQPHFPGYPYFILGGYFFHQWVTDKAASLTLFNIVAYASATIPMYKLSRDYLSRSFSLLMTAMCYSAGFIILMVNQPMSEGAAISVLWWYVWSIYITYKKQSYWANVVPLFLLSVLLGIRLSYLPFSIGVLFLVYKKWKNKQLQITQIASLGFFAVCFQLLWIGAVALTEGSLVGFIKLAIAFTSGHFTDWGGTVASTNLSFFERLYQLIIKNIVWTGMTVRSYLLACMFIIYIGCFFRAVQWNMIKQNFLAQLFIILISSYFLWALFAQNVDKPRHIIPVITLCLFGLYVVIFSKCKKGMVIGLSVVFLAVQAYHTVSLLKEQARELPATYQLAAYLEKHKEQFVIYTWEESRVFTYLDLPFSHKEIYTYSKFLHDKSYYKNKEILLTDKVVAGFKAQGDNLTGKVEKIEEFSSNSIFDPVYHQIGLYKWNSTE